MPVLDIHVHIGGIQRRSTGCYMSKPQIEHLRKELPSKLRFRLRIAEALGFLDAAIKKRLLGFVNGAEDVDYIVLLPMDGIYNEQGLIDWERTTFYVPNDYVLNIAKHSKKILPAASINPLRRDWEEELDRVVEMGAKLIKWLPSSMQFDPADIKFKLFYKRLAEKNIPLLSHTGYEHTILSAYSDGMQALGQPSRLNQALQAGVTVIMAHSGTSGGEGEPDYFEDFVRMALEYENLYGDTAAFTHWTRAHLMKKILKNKWIFDRLIHGSDATLQPSLGAFAGTLSRDLLQELSQVDNPLIKDYKLKRALGFPDDVFHRGSWLLKPA